MSFANIIGILQQYANPSTANPTNVEQHFDQVAQSAPQSHLASGLSEAFRSGQGGGFGQVVGNLFGQSNGAQQAGILNHLLGALGPAAGASILGNLVSGSGNTQLTPEQAQQVPPEKVQQMAEQAQQRDPSIVDTAGNFYAQHPTLVKALGAGSLALIMSHMSRSQ